MSALDSVVPVGVGLPCAVCSRVPPQIVALCPVCDEAIKARIAHIERLEAALSEYAQAHDRYCDAGERQSRWFDAANAVLLLGREISKGRKP